MAKISLFPFLFGSAILHGLVGLCCFLYFEFQQPSMHLSLQPPIGASVGVQFVQKSTQNRSSQTTSLAAGNSQEGARHIQKEVDGFLKNLRYPATALEKELEDQCEWLVVVAENGHAKILEETQKCRYSIFREAFEKAISEYQFLLPSGVQMKIPVQFRIHYERRR